MPRHPMGRQQFCAQPSQSYSLYNPLPARRHKAMDDNKYDTADHSNGTTSQRSYAAYYTVTDWSLAALHTVTVQ